MTRRFPLALALCIAAASAAATGAYAQTPAAAAAPPALSLETGVPPHPGLDAVYREFSRAYDALEPGRVADLYAEDALYLAPGRDVLRGKPEIRKEFEGFFASVKESGGTVAIRFRILDRRVSETLAVDVGVFTLVSKRPEKPDAVSEGKFAVAFQRNVNGAWKFRVDSYSPIQPDRPAPGPAPKQKS
jgi:uncharacterized protein (TIGR02246 family)